MNPSYLLDAADLCSNKISYISCFCFITARNLYKLEVVYPLSQMVGEWQDTVFRILEHSSVIKARKACPPWPSIARIVRVFKSMSVVIPGCITPTVANNHRIAPETAKVFDVADCSKKLLISSSVKKIGKPVVSGQERNINNFTQHSVIFGNCKLVVIMSTS
jgi:hypothetical protein